MEFQTFLTRAQSHVTGVSIDKKRRKKNQLYYMPILHRIRATCRIPTCIYLLGNRSQTVICGVKLVWTHMDMNRNI